MHAIRILVSTCLWAIIIPALFFFASTFLNAREDLRWSLLPTYFAVFGLAAFAFWLTWFAPKTSSTKRLRRIAGLLISFVLFIPASLLALFIFLVWLTKSW
jgi:hypothetical protein